MESLSNINTRASLQQQNTLKKLLSDMGKLDRNPIHTSYNIRLDALNWTCNYYPQVNAYVILFSNQLIFYFLSDNNVAILPTINTIILNIFIINHCYRLFLFLFLWKLKLTIAKMCPFSSCLRKWAFQAT